MSLTALVIGISAGWRSPAFGITLTVALVVIIDALGLRRQLGAHAAALNSLIGEPGQRQRLRERMGHSILEVAAGVSVGGACALVLRAIFAE